MKKDQLKGTEAPHSDMNCGSESFEYPAQSSDYSLFPIRTVMKIIFWFILTGDFVFLFVTVGSCGEDLIPFCFIIFLAVIAVSLVTIGWLTVFLDMAEDIRRIKDMLEGFSRNEREQ